MIIKKTGYIKISFSEDFYWIYGASGATYVKENFQSLFPKIAVPTLTSVEPSSTAIV